MKLNFNVQFTDIDGQDVVQDGKPILIGKEFAKYLSIESHKDTGIEPLDALENALKMNRGEAIDLDKKEQAAYRDWVIKCNNMNVLLKGQIIAIMDAKKDATADTTE